MCFLAICLSSAFNFLKPGNFSADSNHPNSERSCAKHSTWCQTACPPYFMPTSVSWAIFLIRTSSLEILRWQPAQPARPDTAYSIPKSLMSISMALESESAPRFFPLPFASGTTMLEPPKFSLSSFWSSIRNLANPSIAASEAGRCFLKKHNLWNQLGCLPSWKADCVRDLKQFEVILHEYMPLWMYIVCIAQLEIPMKMCRSIFVRSYCVLINIHEHLPFTAM